MPTLIKVTEDTEITAYIVASQVTLFVATDEQEVSVFTSEGQNALAAKCPADLFAKAMLSPLPIVDLTTPEGIAEMEASLKPEPTMFDKHVMLVEALNKKNQQEKPTPLRGEALIALEEALKNSTTSEPTLPWVKHAAQSKPAQPKPAEAITVDDLKPGMKVLLENKIDKCFIPCQIASVFGRNLKWIYFTPVKDIKYFREGKSYEIHKANIGRLVLLPEAMPLDPKLRAMLDDFVKELDENLGDMTADELINRFVAAKSVVSVNDLKPGMRVVLDSRIHNRPIPCEIISVNEKHAVIKPEKNILVDDVNAEWIFRNVLLEILIIDIMKIQLLPKLQYKQPE